MRVQVAHMGWCAPPDNLRYLMPEGYHRYLCIAANGIVTFVNTTDTIPNGEYELSDEDWSYDHPRWEKEAAQENEEIEIA